MGKSELFRQTEDYVSDSVMLDWMEENVHIAQMFFYGVLIASNKNLTFSGESFRDALKEAVTHE